MLRGRHPEEASVPPPLDGRARSCRAGYGIVGGGGTPSETLPTRWVVLDVYCSWIYSSICSCACREGTRRRRFPGDESCNLLLGACDSISNLRSGPRGVRIEVSHSLAQTESRALTSPFYIL